MMADFIEEVGLQLVLAAIVCVGLWWWGWDVPITHIVWWALLVLSMIPAIDLWANTDLQAQSNLDKIVPTAAWSLVGIWWTLLFLAWHLIIEEP